MDEHATDPTTRESLSLSALLTPKACALSGFAFAVLAMTGQGVWTQAVQAIWGVNYPQSRVSAVLASGIAATLVPAVAGFLLGLRALAATRATDAWEGHLARAAMIVAGVAGMLALVGIMLNLVGLAAGY